MARSMLLPAVNIGIDFKAVPYLGTIAVYGPHVSIDYFRWPVTDRWHSRVPGVECSAATTTCRLGIRILWARCARPAIEQFHRKIRNSTDFRWPIPFLDQRRINALPVFTAELAWSK